MNGTVRMAGPKSEPMVEYLREIETRLEQNGVPSATRREILTELKSHLVDRIAEFQAEGLPDPLGQALGLLGDASEIASEFAATALPRRAGRGFSPRLMLAAAWSLARHFGYGLRLFVIGVIGYALSAVGVVAAVAKLVSPERVGFWAGDHGLTWGPVPEGALALELAGRWFIPVSLWFAILLAAGTTLLLRSYIRMFLASRRLPTAAAGRPTA